MTNPLEMIQPGLRFLREQRELEKVLVVETPRGADGLGPVDLDSGRIQIPVATPPVSSEPTDEG